MKKVLIIGGGAAGLETATHLGNALGQSFAAEITLIDKNLSYIWKPLWHEIAAGRIDIAKDKTEYLTHAEDHNYKFKLGSLIDIDRQNKTILLEIPNVKQELTPSLIKLDYDYLILAVGSIHNDFKIKGVTEFCLTFDSINECNIFHKNLTIELFNLIQTNKNELDIAIVGGGSTGVELAFEVNNTITEFLKHATISKTNASINLSIIESAPQILGNLSDSLKEKTITLLKNAGIKIYTHEKVNKIDQDFIYTESEKQIKANIKLWATGIKAPDILTKIGARTNKKNQLLILDTLQLIDDENIFAIGDCANFVEQSKSLPPTAQLAHQQAQFLTSSLAKLIKFGKPLQKFQFKNQGTLISASKTNAIGEVTNKIIGKIKLNKKFAYFSYRLLYRRYQASIYSWPKVIILMIIDFLTRQIKPSIKLH